MATWHDESDRYRLTPTFSLNDVNEIIAAERIMEVRHAPGRDGDSYEAVKQYVFLLRGGFTYRCNPGDLYPEVQEEWFPAEDTLIPHDLQMPEGR